MPATQNIEMAKGYDAASAVTKNRFVKFTTADPLSVEQCNAQGEDACGVTMFTVSDAEILRGKGVSVIHEGIAILEASEAIVTGAKVTTGADGRVENANSGDWILGTCREPASGANAQCSVLLDVPAVSTLA